MPAPIYGHTLTVVEKCGRCNKEMSEHVSEYLTCPDIVAKHQRETNSTCTCVACKTLYDESR